MPAFSTPKRDRGIAVPRAEPRARRRARRRCSAAPNRGGDGPRLRTPAVSRRGRGRRGARPRSKCVVPDANATAHERFAPSSTAAGTPLGGKVVLEATPRSPGALGGEGERSRANGAIFGRGRRARQHEEVEEVRRLFARIQKMRRVAFVRRGESHRRDLLLFGADVFFFFDAGVFFVDVSGARFFVPVLKVVGCVRKPLSSWRGIT